MINYFINKQFQELERIEKTLNRFPDAGTNPNPNRMAIGHIMLLEEQKKLIGNINRESKAFGVLNPLKKRNQLMNKFKTNQSLRVINPYVIKNKSLDTSDNKYRGSTRTTGIVDNQTRTTTLKGGPKLSFSIKNKNVLNSAPLDYYLTSYPVDKNGQRITTIDAPPRSEFLNLLPLTTYRANHFAGDIGDSYIHNIRVTPRTRSTATKFFVFVDMEASY